MLRIIFRFGITCLDINIKASLTFKVPIKMMKSAIIGSMLLGVALSGYVTDINNNLIEYDLEDLQPMQISFPYPYQSRHPQVRIEPAPVYSTPHKNIIVPSTTEIEVVKSYPGFIYTAISCAYEAAKSAIVFLLSHAPALAAGTAVALGVCKMTSLCSSQITIIEAQRELRSIASSDTLASVTEFLKEAIRKYNEMQR